MLNQRWNNIVYFNLEIYNFELTLSISMLILKTLENVDVMLLFLRSSFTMLINVETTLRVLPFSKKWKEQKSFAEPQERDHCLINNTSFTLWSIKKKEKHETYYLKMNVGKYNTWYMKKVCWWQNKVMYGMTLLVLIYTLLCFLDFISWKSSICIFYYIIYFRFSILFYSCYYFML